MRETSAPATKVQNNFGSYLAQVNTTGIPLLIERHGRPVAVLVSHKTWQEKTKENKPKKYSWADACRKFTDQLRKKHPGQKDVPAVELIRQLRAEH